MPSGVVGGPVPVMLATFGGTDKAKRCRRGGSAIRYQSDPNTFTCGAGPMGIQHARKELRTANKRRRKKRKHKLRSVKKSKK
jgi:hypothetical protein